MVDRLTESQANALQESDVLTMLKDRGVDLIMTIQAKTVQSVMMVGDELLMLSGLMLFLKVAA